MPGNHLFFLCGIPHPYASKRSSRLNKDQALKRIGTFIDIPAAINTAPYKKPYIDVVWDRIFKEVSKAEKGETKEDKRPDSLRIVYRNDKTASNLVNEFFISSKLTPIEVQTNQFMLSESHNVIKDTIINEPPSQLISKQDAMRLPMDNFSNRKPLRELFLSFATGDLSRVELNREIPRKCYTREDIYLIQRGKKSFFTDSRNIVFAPCKPTERHGIARKNNIQAYINGNYRFGSKIEKGFHFDCQRPKGQSLKGVTFTCSIKGQIILQPSTTHANIYLNDFVRV